MFGLISHDLLIFIDSEIFPDDMVKGGGYIVEYGSTQ